MLNTSRRAHAALVMLGVGTFSYVTIEVLPIGLLTVMAADLDRSRSDIGLLVTGYAVVVVLASIPLARLTLGLPRRPVLGTTLGLMAVGAAGAALAPTYEVLLIARLFTALSHALFWSIIFPIAAGLVPSAVRGRVVAKISVGSALAPVIGIPLGTWLGEQAGWRIPFALMAVLGTATCLSIASLLPRVDARESTSGRGSAPDVRRYAVLVVSTALGVAGFLTFNTYVTPFLLDISGFTSGALGPILLASGLGGLTGTLLVSRILDRNPWAAVALPLALIGAALLGLYTLGHRQVPTVLLIATAGMAFSALAVAVLSRTLQVAPGSTDLASAGTSSAFNIGIAAGAFIGGGLLDSTGVRSVALVGGLLAILALVAITADEPVLARRGMGMGECVHERPGRQVCEEAA
ncbi:DHA1 family L-arabinose/isopropyl-beta-D-thiogalactopyranoside export protein-like MFS transporter/DHA1 family inner membrane transport protein [Kribbella sp. VKM Ac-2527]|uniref:DHA1 family L-arabinose/isopropyl-beta-D-thiogalactopyranoside export protein-like MFS transporter/DHA1 family inner membrane transport protein n=1 Tax=Kribbella caucasensis TaxID=2512215 RepID=A0A4R6KCD9_9ACTN|nr:MFS transporter [Kribbella sp. VKM Ac-2527]TDO45402.1 DHA1 family L-arabinose/isopropyl-beta-D-thiogalactopyranoside export protein-like MFS transporter/DHA1 family inner membrane transport protein [Kribbella sp. VKM Ac-2527]